MTKREVCKYLGKSKRTIEGYVVRGHLNVDHVPGPNGPVAIFDRAAVKKFRREWAERSSYPSLVRRGSIDPSAATVVVRRPPAKPLALPPVAPAYQPVTLDTYVPLGEAAKRSGLPKSYLLSQAREGAPWALNAAAEGKRPIWRFRVRPETVSL